MKWFRRFESHRPEDPGDAWADALLAPLRREEAACDVAPRIMQRIGAQRSAVPLSPVRRRTPRLAWAAWLLLGFASLVFLLSSMIVLVVGGDEGVAMLWSILAPVGRLALAFGHHLMTLVSAAAAAGLALLRGVWIFIEAAAPLVRGVGLFAAACGLLSIVVSTCLFAHARLRAPVTGLRNQITFQGGSR